MWLVQGQDHIIRQLKTGIQLRRLSHAYMFVGPRHVGKGTLALNLAQVINCASVVDASPCGECSQCQRIAKGHHTDVRIVRAEEAKPGRPKQSGIGIDDVRIVSNQAQLKPYEGSCRVFIFEDAETMNDEAANALLKTLEDPPPQTLFILLTSQEDQILTTISSRCQKVELLPMSRKGIATFLVTNGYMNEIDAEEISHFSKGSLGWALSTVENPLILERRTSELDRLVVLLDANIEQRFHAASDIASTYYRDRHEATEILNIWLSWWRDLMLLKEGSKDTIYNRDYIDSLKKWRPIFSSIQVTEFIAEIYKTQEALQYNINPRLTMETLMLSVPDIT